ncbi:MAG: hypothetical protein U0572_03450 [Phycisphaerales bacterium]
MRNVTSLATGLIVAFVVSQLLRFTVVAMWFQRTGGAPKGTTAILTGEAKIPASADEQVIALLVCGVIAGFAGGWASASMDEDGGAAKRLAIAFLALGLLIGGLGAAAGRSDIAIGIGMVSVAQAVGAFLGGRFLFAE